MSQQTQKSKLQTGVSASVKKSPVLPKHRRQDVVGCSACGQDHTRVLFFLRENWKAKKYQYRATCPLSGEEILLRVE